MKFREKALLSTTLSVVPLSVVGFFGRAKKHTKGSDLELHKNHKNKNPFSSFFFLAVRNLDIVC